jgi:hypothetical protein
LAPSLSKIAALSVAAIIAYFVSYSLLVTAFSPNIGGSYGVDLQTVKFTSGIIGLSSALAVHRLYGWGRKMVRRLLSKIHGYTEKGKKHSERISGKSRETVKKDDQ